MECKAALTEAGGNVEDAITILRKRGLSQAAKKVGRATNNGMVGSYIHMGGKIGVLIEVNCESDFVARTEDFQALAKELAMQVAASNPTYARREDVPADVIEREKTIYRAQLEGSNKPAPVIEKIVEGKLESYYEQAVLVRITPLCHLSGRYILCGVAGRSTQYFSAYNHKREYGTDTRPDLRG